MRAVDDASICLVTVEYADGPSEIYVTADRLDDPEVALALLDDFAGATLATERGGALEFRPTHLFETVARERLMPVAVMRGEQSNTSIRFGQELILKLFRRLQFGPNPEVEVGRFLTDYTSFRNAPPVIGSAAYIDPLGREAALALLQRFEPNRGDASRLWSCATSRDALSMLSCRRWRSALVTAACAAVEWCDPTKKTTAINKTADDRIYLIVFFLRTIPTPSDLTPDF